MLLSARSNSRFCRRSSSLPLLQIVALTPQFLLHLLLRHAVDERGAERRQHDQHGTAGNRQRHGGVIDPARNHDDGRIVLHADGTHGREVHEADGQRQQRSARPTWRMRRGRRWNATMAAAPRAMPPSDGNRAQSEIPLQLCPARPGPACRRNAWRETPAPIDRSADDGVPVARPGRDPKSQAGDDHGDDQRHDRRQGRVGRGHARAIGQHGHEMRGPDARHRR